jgi:hypothetical protein
MGDSSRMSVIENYSIMGIPFHDLVKDPAMPFGQKRPGVVTFRQSLLAHQTVHWRQQQGLDTTYKAAKQWLNRSGSALMASEDEESFEAIHKLWQRAEKGVALRDKNSTELLRFMGLSDDYNPRRNQKSGELVRHHGDLLHGRFALHGEAQLADQPMESTPALPTLLLDVLALNDEVMTTARNPNKKIAEASARNMAIELILLRLAQGLMMSKWAFEARISHQVLHEAEHTDWPLQVARHLNIQEETSVEPWAGFLELTASLAVRVRHSVRADLLPELSGYRRASSRLDLWLGKVLSPDGNLPVDLAQIARRDEHGPQIIEQAERVREPLKIACRRLGLSELPTFIYEQLDQGRRRDLRSVLHTGIDMSGEHPMQGMVAAGV